jgi:hypothetical protein
VITSRRSLLASFGLTLLVAALAASGASASTIGAGTLHKPSAHHRTALHHPGTHHAAASHKAHAAHGALTHRTTQKKIKTG